MIARYSYKYQYVIIQMDLNIWQFVANYSPFRSQSTRPCHEVPARLTLSAHSRPETDLPVSKADGTIITRCHIEYYIL